MTDKSKISSFKSLKTSTDCQEKCDQRAPECTGYQWITSGSDLECKLVLESVDLTSELVAGVECF